MCVWKLLNIQIWEAYEHKAFWLLHFGSYGPSNQTRWSTKQEHDYCCPLVVWLFYDERHFISLNMEIMLGFGNVEWKCLFRSSEWSSKSVLMSVNNHFLTTLRVAFLLWFVLKYKAGGLVALGSWMLNGRCWIKHESVRGFLEWWYLNCLVGLVLLSI